MGFTAGGAENLTRVSMKIMALVAVLPSPGGVQYDSCFTCCGIVLWPGLQDGV